MVEANDTRRPIVARWRRWLGNIALAFASLLVSLFVAEYTVRLIDPQKTKGQFYELAPRGYKVLRSSGTAFNEDGDTVRFSYPHLRDAPAPSGAERILVLGDSYTEAWYLPEEKTIVGRLQKKLNSSFGDDRVVLLNAAISGSGTADHLAFLEDFGEQIAPAAVIEMVSIDDFRRAEKASLYQLAQPGSLDLIKKSHLWNPIFKALLTSRAYNYLSEHSQLMQLIRIAAREIAPSVANPNAPSSKEEKTIDSGVRGTWPEVPQKQKQLARALFHRMKTWCVAHNVHLIVVNNGWREYDWLVDLLSKDGITAFDVYPNVQAKILENRRLFTRLDGHPNAKGQSVTADAVWPFIRDRIIQWNLALPQATR
jgi:lysophospholipase L1-like esterase